MRTHSLSSILHTFTIYSLPASGLQTHVAYYRVILSFTIVAIQMQTFAVYFDVRRSHVEKLPFLLRTVPHYLMRVLHIIGL